MVALNLQHGIRNAVCEHRSPGYNYNGEPLRSHLFDTGITWQNHAVEGTKRGLIVHGTGGFDDEQATAILLLSSEYAIESMAAIDVQVSPNALPPEMQEHEEPSDRKPLSDIVLEGTFDGTEHGGGE